MDMIHWLPIIVILAQLYSARCTTVQAEYCELQKNDGQSWNRMEVLPGIGWDNLRNVEMGEVFEHDYSMCQLTNDRKFLIPDGFFAIPLQQSNVEAFSELMDHWDNHTSLTSTSINTEANYLSVISGKFSADYIKNKMTMYNENSVVSRVQIRHKLYIIRLQAGVKLHPFFKTRLLDIAAYMIGNNTNIAHYLAELLVRDYGTHYTSALHAGAILVQEDYLDKKSLVDTTGVKQQITASSSANFFGRIGFSLSATHTSVQKDSSSYNDNLKYSHVRTFGGPPFRADFTLNNWEDGLADALVAIDREGDPLYYAIIPEALPELPPLITLKLAQYVEHAVNLYYKHNTITGCTQPDATNFYFAANADDGSCVIPESFTFGGVYQTCESYTPSGVTDDEVCPNLIQKNPSTGDYTCPPPYEAIQLYTGEKQASKVVGYKDCKNYVVFEHCKTKYKQVTITGVYSTYWCVATGNIPPKSGFMFGGLYNSMTTNSITQGKSCPNYYHALRFGEDTHVCVSNDPELGYAQSLPFGGFESCRAGNPLALVNLSSNADTTENRNYTVFGVLEISHNNLPHRCPKGYTQHLASMEQSCDISYCLKAGSLGEKGLPPIRRLPFRRQPQHNANSSDVLSITSPLGDLWLKNETTKEWYKVIETPADALQKAEHVMTATSINPASTIIPASKSAIPLTNLTDSSSITSSTSAREDNNADNTPITVALVISSTALIGLVLVVAVYGIYKCKRPKSSQHGYSNLDKPVNTTGNEMETNTDV